MDLSTFKSLLKLKMKTYFDGLISTNTAANEYHQFSRILHFSPSNVVELIYNVLLAGKFDTKELSQDIGWPARNTSYDNFLTFLLIRLAEVLEEQLVRQSQSLDVQLQDSTFMYRIDQIVQNISYFEEFSEESKQTLRLLKDLNDNYKQSVQANKSLKG
jgi:hypothetical protein